MDVTFEQFEEATLKLEGARPLKKTQKKPQTCKAHESYPSKQNLKQHKPMTPLQPISGFPG